MKSIAMMHGDRMVFQDDFGLPQFGKREVIDDKARAAARIPQIKHRRLRLRRFGELLARPGACSELVCLLATRPTRLPSGTLVPLVDAVFSKGRVFVCSWDERRACGARAAGEYSNGPKI